MFVGSGSATSSGRERRPITSRPAPPSAPASAVITPIVTSTARREVPPSAASSEGARTTPRASRSRYHREESPAARVASTGRTSRAWTAGRVSTAVAATATSRTISPSPSARRFLVSSPATAANTSTAASTDPSRIGLSMVPKFLIAHSFTGVGVRSMMLELTASTGEESGCNREATRWPAAMPSRVAMTPKPA